MIFIIQNHTEYNCHAFCFPIELNGDDYLLNHFITAKEKNIRKGIVKLIKI
jgi:hypothetical protein